MHKYQRAMFYQIKRFLTDGDPACRIGVLVGIRRIGKTCILTDLDEYFREYEHRDTKYVDFRKDSSEARRSCLEFIQNCDKGFLLIDEITDYHGYGDLIDYIQTAVYNQKPGLRVIFAGSSLLHLLALHYGLLGGSRSKLFRLSFLSFAEYLVFTDKHSGEAYEFAEQVNITKADFIDYVHLNGLETSGLNLIFNDDYMRGVYHDISNAARTPVMKGVLAELTQDDLNCVLDLVAYTLANAVSRATFDHSKAMRELDVLCVPDIDVTGMRLCLTVEQLSEMRPENIVKALYFLLEANLAYVETMYEDSSLLTADKLAEKILLLTSRADLARIFEQYNICLVSPLWYTKLAIEILDRHNISLDALLESSILGEIIENYVKGSYCRFNSGVNYHLYKIGSVSDERANLASLSSEDVDLFDPKLKLLCELSKDNNKRQHNLMKHYANIPYIRILSSEDEESTKGGINKIAFPRLCAMVDTGEIFSLERTVDTSEKDKRTESIPINQSSTISVNPYE